MQIPKKKMKDKEIYKIISEDDSELLVSEKHKVYVGKKKLFNIPQKLSFDSKFDSCFMHASIISNKSRICKLGAGYENAIKSADFGFSSDSNSLFNKEYIINDSSMLPDIIRSLNSPFILAGESCGNSRNFNNSGRRDAHHILPELDFSSYGFGDRMQPELLSIDRILLPSSRRDNSSGKNSSVKSDVHKLYSLSRICLISLVESMSDIRSFSISLFNSDNSSFLFFLNPSSAIRECNSISTFINLFIINESSILTSQGINNSNTYLNLSNFKLRRISDVYNELDNNQLVFLDEQGNEIKVKKISKEQYSGRIYDVTVPNHIILVKRGDLIVWSGNSYNNFTSLADGRCAILDEKINKIEEVNKK